MPLRFKEYILKEDFFNAKAITPSSNILVCGGAYGHLSNVYDINYSFKEMKDIIKATLKGELERVRLKTDGQNLMFSVIDGQIRVARNAGHIKNFGANSLTAEGLAAKFKGRGGLEVAYNNAIADLKNAFSKVPSDKIEKMFQNGKKFMSMEVMHVDSENVISYGSNQIRFHGTMEYDESGNVIGENKQDGDDLAKWIADAGQRKQATFSINPLEVVKLEPVPDYNSQKISFISELDSIKKKYKLSDSNTLDDYKLSHFEYLLKDQGIVDPDLAKRWAFGDKNINIREIKKRYDGKQLSFITKIENNIKNEYKNIMLPFEHLFLRLGATVLKDISQFMVANPDQSIQNLKKKLDSAIKKIEGSKDPKMLAKLKMELERIQAAGGVDVMVPEEGITFLYKGTFMKFTGTFAPVNQIIGMLYNLTGDKS